MFRLIDEKIRSYETIIIHRHKNPDMDAIGSQVGLFYLIKDNFPEKTVYLVGDTNKFDRENMMTEIADQVYNESLVFIVDVAVKELVSDQRYNLAKEIIIIDHHENLSNIDRATTFIDTRYSSATEYLTTIFKSLDYSFSPQAASYLFAGLITDTGRFMWMKNPKNVFLTAAFLIENGAETKEFYDWLYTEPLEVKKMKNYFQAKYVYEDNIAYLKNDATVFEKFDVDFFTVSRGMVNLASGIEEIKIWLNFTYNKANNTVVGEFRSRDINIVDVAKEFGGGGHANACGATLKDFKEADLVIKRYKELLKEKEYAR